MMMYNKGAFSVGSGADRRNLGLGLAMGLSLLLGGCSGSGRDYLDDLLQDLKPGSGHGGHNPPPAGDCAFVSWDTVYEGVEGDLLRLDPEDRAFQRYFTLANLVGSSRCGDSADLLSAVSDTLELTSRGPASGELVLAFTKNARTYRIDLRDFGWDSGSGTLTVGGTTFADPWEAVINATPYAVEFQGDNAENVELVTNTAAPLLFADAFVSVAGRGPIFAALGGSGTSPSITAVLAGFDADVGIGVVAGDLLFPEDALESNLPRLNPALSGLDNGLKVDRNDWSGLYVESLCITSVANENRPSDAVCVSAGL